MSKLSLQELEKMRKESLHSVTLSSDMKATVIDARLKELTLTIKKHLSKKDVVLEVLVVQR